MIRLPDTYPLVLASQSPRRRELLTAAGYKFEVIPASDSAEDDIWGDEKPDELVARLAYQKAADVAIRVDRAVLIACDTVAVCRNRILGKPLDRDDARRMLKTLSGTEHHVLSGLCVWNVPDEAPLTEVDVTTLYMDPLTDEQIEAYLNTGQWKGKAGAFGYQDGLDWLHVTLGMESNVVGLPMHRLKRMLEEVGYPVPE